jgi:RND family efflux transporter MFP subunit
MLALVRIALGRPYTFVVAALLIFLVGTLAALRMPVDIFPSINIPIIGVAFQYQGLPPDQMAGRIITPFERALTTTVNDIEHFEANSYNTFGIVKIFFHPTVNIATANAQVTAISQSLLKQMPPGTTPPLIINYSASTVPIIQLALSGKGLTEQNLADLGMNFVRPRLVTVQGAGIPWPFGGKSPQVMFDLDTAALESRSLTGLDVANALAAQNLITPVGTEKIGDYEYTVNLNSAPSTIPELGNLPIKSVGGAMVYMHDVAQANAKLAQISAERWQSLAGTDAVAKQDVDQRTFTLNANIAQVKAAQANVDRLIAEEGFKRLIAPFDGIVTARETDIGALINVGAAGGAELFVVSETSKLRVYVNVPQNYVPSVPPGTKAMIRVPEHPDKTYSGTVEASAQAVNPSSGTTLMQLIVDNSAGEMMPGDYVSIELQIAAAAHVLSVPSSALIFDAKGLSIATVDADNRVLLKPVSIERDLGAVIELASGLSPDNRVIQNPPDGIGNGAAVRLAGAASVGVNAGQAKHKNDKG